MIGVIERTLELDASVDEVWRALTDPTELSAWFGDSTELSAAVGSEGWFGWEKHGRFAMRVEVFEPKTRFSWRWSHESGASLGDTPTTLVEWTLVAREDGGTTLNLRESGFETESHRSENQTGWQQELAELEAHLTAH